jgi:hypothetical protein
VLIHIELNYFAAVPDLPKVAVNVIDERKSAMT